jgi:uncharacterized damage-inducible protein DinB
MSEVDRLIDQMARAWDGDAWHGPPLRKLLADVDPKTADGRPIAGVHSTAEIVRHVAFWKDVARRRLKGERVEPSDAESWPAAPATWPMTLADLAARYDQLVAAVAPLSDDRLDDVVPGKESDHTVYVMLSGVVQHDLYHAGQIALLKRAARS